MAPPLLVSYSVYSSDDEMEREIVRQCRLYREYRCIDCDALNEGQKTKSKGHAFAVLVCAVWREWKMERVTT